MKRSRHQLKRSMYQRAAKQRWQRTGVSTSEHLSQYPKRKRRRRKSPPQDKKERRREGNEAFCENAEQIRGIARMVGMTVAAKQFQRDGKPVSWHVMFNAGRERIADYWPGTGTVMVLGKRYCAATPKEAVYIAVDSMNEVLGKAKFSESDSERHLDSIAGER